MSDVTSQKTNPLAVQSGDSHFVETGVRRLTPENTLLFEVNLGVLHCRVSDDPMLYRGIWAVLMFPITYPDSFISLRYTDADDKDQEIGVVIDLASFPSEIRELIHRAVVKQYYQQTIQRIYTIDCQYGVLFFDAETDFGRTTFVIPWRYDRAEDFDVRGKVLLDSLDNRYVIPDVEALPPADRRVFLSYIYW